METPEFHQDGKMELIFIASELMPKGVPNLTGVIKYPTIESLRQELGKKVALTLVLALVKDLCSSINVVRNMNEDQMLETASMLLDECGSFRLEDYVMMFALAKRGQLVKIYDRIDIDMMGEMMDEYWFRRNQAGRRAQEEEFKTYEENLKQLENKGKEKLSPEEELIQNNFFGDLKKTTEKLCEPSPEEKQKKEKEHKEAVQRHVDFFKATLTPEQVKELEDRRREIEKKASLWEQEQKKKAK